MVRGELLVRHGLRVQHLGPRRDDDAGDTVTGLAQPEAARSIEITQGPIGTTSSLIIAVVRVPAAPGHASAVHRSHAAV